VHEEGQKSDSLGIDGAVTAPCGGRPYFDFGWNGTSGLQRPAWYD
jgi:hypothetical protein